MTPSFICAAGLRPVVALLVLAAALCATVQAYIPAMPTNDSDLILNSANSSSLQLMWYGGIFAEPVSYQLVGADSTGVNEVRWAVPVRAGCRRIEWV